jgi:GGDEF domain-containing protein
MRLAFLDLPDDRVDLISTARSADGVELVLVASADPEALSLRIAEVLQIPRSTEPLDLLGLKPDRVALPSLDSPGATVLLRAGISPGIFLPLTDLGSLLDGTHAPAAADSAPAPIEEWEREFEVAAGTGRRLTEIRDALALSDDRQRLFREVLALSIAETGADAGSLMLVDEDEGELRIAFADGLSHDTVRSVRQKIGEGIAGTVAQSGKPLIVNERVLDPRYKDRERPRIASAMSAPIQLDGRVIAVLNVSSNRQGKRFKDEDLDRLVEIGSQISAILDRVVRRSRSDLEALEFRARQALDRIFRGDNGPRLERLRTAATRLAPRLGAQSVTVYAAESGAREFAVLPSGSGSGETGTLPVHAAGFVGRAHREGESACLTGEIARPGEEGSSRPAVLLVTPLRGKEAHGVLAAEFAGSGDFDPEALAHVLDRVATYLVSLLEHRKPDVGAERRGTLVSLLADIAPRLMVTRELEGLALEAIAALRALFPNGLAVVRLLDREGGVVLRTAYEGSEEGREPSREREASLAVRTMVEGVELSPANRDILEERAPEDEGDAASVPVRTADHIAGALGIVLPPHAGHPGLGEAEMDALRKLALYVSIAWEHVRGLGGEEPEARDRMTGLLTGSGLEARIQEEVKRAERYHEGFLLTLCAIAEFPLLAERHGREFSDRLLREFGASLARNVREVDTVARVGDGRFAVLSPETDKDSGALLKRLDLLLPRLECVRELEAPGDVRLLGRQYAYPDEIATGGELIALIRGE